MSVHANRTHICKGRDNHKYVTIFVDDEDQHKHIHCFALWKISILKKDGSIGFNFQDI